MYKLIIILSFVFSFNANAQIQSFYIKPSQTDAGYAAQDSHYLVYNLTKPITKLVLFIGGSYSRPGNYNLFCDNAATLGFDVISLSYPNNIAAASLAGNSDSLAFNKYRQEIAFGTPQSPDVFVDSFNSIYTRTLKLLNFLNSTSNHNFGNYLINSTTIDWSKIIIAGHSQGSGHACYLAKKFPVDRVIMLSGPNDFSTFFNNSANWLRTSGVTPSNRMFTLLHLNDEIVPFSQQFQNNKGLGMLMNDDTTLIDNSASPYSNSQFLYTNVAAISQHSSTTGAQPKVKEAWNYMLTKTILSSGSQIESYNESSYLIYPNPISEILNIEFKNRNTQETIKIYNQFGIKIYSKEIKNQLQIPIDFSNYPKGVYVIEIGGELKKLIKD